MCPYCKVCSSYVSEETVRRSSEVYKNAFDEEFYRFWINKCIECGLYSLYDDKLKTQNKLVDPSNKESEMVV